MGLPLLKKMTSDPSSLLSTVWMKRSKLGLLGCRGRCTRLGGEMRRNLGLSGVKSDERLGRNTAGSLVFL